MLGHQRRLPAFLIAAVAATFSRAHGAEDKSFVESVETTRMVATGTLKEYRLGGYLVSSTGSKANISIEMNWETVHFGLKPQQARLFRQIPVKRGTKPKLQYSKGDKVIVSWETSAQDSLRIAPWSQALEEQVLKALSQRREALVKKHGAAKAKLIEQAIGILGSATARAPQANAAAVDHSDHRRVLPTRRPRAGHHCHEGQGLGGRRQGHRSARRARARSGQTQFRR